MRLLSSLNISPSGISASSPPLESPDGGIMLRPTQTKGPNTMKKHTQADWSGVGLSILSSGRPSATEAMRNSAEITEVGFMLMMHHTRIARVLSTDFR